MPPLFTSIPPQLHGVKLEPNANRSPQVLAIESWLNSGFKPISLNLAQEIQLHAGLPEVLRHHGVETVAITPEMRLWTSAPLCPLRDFLTAISAHSPNAPFAILNADIRLAPSADHALAEYVAALDETEFLIGQRWDITYLPYGSRHSNIHGYGIDFVAFHSSWIPRIINALSPTLAIGLPWWDHYLPLALSAHGVQTRLIDARWFEHDVHHFNWNWDHYCRIGRTAMETFHRAILPLKSSVSAQCWLHALVKETYHPLTPSALVPMVQKITFHRSAPTFVAKSSLARLANANMRILLQSATHGPVPQPNRP